MNRQGPFPEYLKRAVLNADWFIPVLSVSYLEFQDTDTKVSWCLDEAITAMKGNIPIVPVRLPGLEKGKYYRDRKPKCKELSNESRPTDDDKELVRYTLDVAESAEFKDEDSSWYLNLKKLIFDSFCDIEQVALFTEYLREHIDTDIIQLSGRDGFTHEDEALYVKLCAHRKFTPTEKEKMDQDSEQNIDSQPIPAENLMESVLNNQFSIITGEAGQGKTVFLKKIQEVYSKKAVSGGLNRNLLFPIYLDCKHIVENQKLYSSFPDCLAKTASLKLFLFECIIEKGSPLLLINGLDEIHENAAREILTSLNELKQCKMVFSSRPRGVALHGIQIAAEDVPEYSLDPLNETQLENLTKALFIFSAKKDDRQKIKERANNPKIQMQYLRIIAEREKETPDYRQISRNPFYAYPLVTYYLQKKNLPENSIVLLDYFTTSILRRRLDDDSISIKQIKNVLGYLAMQAYLSRADHEIESYSYQEIEAACECSGVSEEFEQKLKRYVIHSPYFTENRGFIHDAYAAYSAAFFWWHKEKKEETLQILLNAGTTCEKAVEAILNYIDIATEPKDTWIAQIMDNLQGAMQTPCYDRLCQLASGFIRHKSAAEDQLLRGMFDRGIQGILTFDEDGVNPYDELFYYAVTFNYAEAVKRYETIAYCDEDAKVKAYIESVLLHDLHSIFDQEEIQIDQSNPLYPRLLKASSYKRGKQICGHINLCKYEEDNELAYNLFYKITSLIVRKEYVNSENSFFDCSLPALEYIKAEPYNPRYYSINNCLIDHEKNCLLKGCKTSIIPDDGSVREIEDRAFYGCTRLKKLIIPDGIQKIGRQSFRGCYRLTSIKIPEGVREIGDGAFSYCSNLNSLILPDSVKETGNHAFYGCTGLTFLKIPEGVEKIKRSTFEDCSHLTFIEIPDSVQDIENSAFYGCKELTSLIIPQNVNKIGDSAFFNCANLTSIKIPSGVEKIQGGTFHGCSKLESVEIPNSVWCIGDHAFYNCLCLKSVMIPPGIEEIEGSTFEGCSGLTSIHLSCWTKEIGRSAFGDCTSLTSIEIPDSIEKIGTEVFKNCSNLKKVIYCGSKKRWGHVSGCGELCQQIILCTDGTIN